MKNRFSRLLAVMLAIVLMMGLLPTDAVAVNEGDWEYFIESDEAVITCYNGSETNVVIPSILEGYPVTCIGERAFERSSVTSVTIPSSITAIGAMAFHHCYGLTNVEISESVLSIGYGAFTDCASMEAIHVAENNSSYKSIDGVLFDKAGTELIQFPNGRDGSYSVPKGVTSIGESAFSHSFALQAVTIPSSVTGIGDAAFNDCLKLTRVTIPESVRSIGNNTFSSCKSMTSISIPTGVTSIGDCAFTLCYGLTSVTIPSSVIVIGYEAFWSCSNLADIWYGGDEMEWLAISIDSGNSDLNNATIHFGCSKFDDWCTANSSTIWNGHTYQVLYSQSGWNYMNTVCEQLGGHLATITSVEENEFLHEYIGRIMDDNPVSFGFTDDGHEGIWTWVTGETSSFTNWSSGEPNNSRQVEHWAYFDLSGRWNDSTNSDGSGCFYICEWEYKMDGLTFMSPESYENRQFHWNGHTYQFLYSETGWNSMKSVCEQRGGHLATITSAEENEYLGGLINTYIPVAFGFTDDGHEGTWTWVTGETSSFTNWNSGEPNNTNQVEHWAYFRSPINGTWNDFSSCIGSDCFYICEWDYGKPIPFNRAIYEANYIYGGLLNHSSTAQAVKTQLGLSTPSSEIISSLQTTSYEGALAIWNFLADLSDYLDDPTNALSNVFKKKDVYTAIVLDMLEASADYKINKSLENDAKKMKEIENTLRTLMQEKFNYSMYDNLDFSSLTQEQKVAFLNDSKDVFEDAYGSTAVSILGDGLAVAKTIEDYVSYTGSCIQLYQLSASMKQLVHELYNDSRSMGNLDLQWALADCVNQVDRSYEQVLLDIENQAFVVSGTTALKFLWKELFWKGFKTELTAMCPAVAILQGIYMGEKLIMNTLVSIDNQDKEYTKMKSVLDVEKLLEVTYSRLGTSLLHNQTEDAAKLYLSAFDVLYNLRDKDCETALKYTEVVDETFIHTIQKQFLGAISWKGVQDSIRTIQSSYLSTHESARVSWVYSLDEDYPGQGLYDQFNYVVNNLYNRYAKKEYKSACPVDVYVYDESGELAASVVDGCVYCNGDMTVALIGDQKVIQFYDDQEYQIVYVGTDEGTMDFTIREFDEGESVTRTINYYDVPLEENTTYSASLIEGVDAGSGDYRIYNVDNDVTVDRNYDSGAVDNVSHTVTVESGLLQRNGSSFLTGEAVCGETLEVTAMLPDHYGFVRWEASNGENIFEDNNSSTTTFIMPAEDTVITAIMELETSELDYYEVVVSDGYGNSIHEAGEYVTIIAKTPEDGKAFINWQGAEELVFIDGSAESEVAVFVMPEHDVSICSEYVDLCSVTFYDEDGTTILAETQKVKPGKTATVPDLAPVKSGHTFIGWFYNGTEFDFSTPITENISLTAEYKLLDPEFKNHAMVLSGEIGVKFKVTCPEGYDMSGVYVDFAVSDGRTETMSFADAESIEGQNARWFICYINALELADTITATLHYGDSSATNTYSAMQYITAARAQYSSSEALMEMLNAIQDYGHYMQESGWTDNWTHEPVAAATELDGDSIETAKTAVADMAFTKMLGDGMEAVSYSLTLNAETKLNIFVKPADGVAVTTEGFTESQSRSGYYQYTTEKIGPKLLGTNVNLIVNTSQGGTATEITVCPMSYVRAILNGTSYTDAQKYAMTAYYNYYAAAIKQS